MQGGPLKCFYQNTRGLRSKIVGLRNRLTLKNFDIVCLTETWLCDGIDFESIFDETYITYRADRTVHTYTRANDQTNEDLMGGGASIAIEKNIYTNRLRHWEMEVPFDNIWIKINAVNAKKNIYQLHLH